MSQPFSGGQSIEASASVSVLPVNIQGWFPLELTEYDLAVQGTLRSLLECHSSKATVLWYLAFFMVKLADIWLWLEYDMLSGLHTFVSWFIFA